MSGKFRIGRRDFFKQAAGAIAATTQIPDWPAFAEAETQSTSPHPRTAAGGSRIHASFPVNSSKCLPSRWVGSPPEAWPSGGEVSCAIGRSSTGRTKAFLRNMPFPRSGSKPEIPNP